MHHYMLHKKGALKYYVSHRGGAQPSVTCILNIALPTRDGCDKF